MFQEDKYILISSFIDNELTDKEKKYVQDKIENDLEWKTVYGTFLENKNSFAVLQELSFDNSSKEAIMSKIRRKRTEEYNAFLPFPRRYIPAVAALLIAAVAVISLFIINRQSEIINFIDKNTSIAKNYYDNILKDGNLYPLNASLNNEDIFRFAAFGILSSESRRNQYVQIGDDDESGLFVKIADAKDAGNKKMNLQLSEVFEKLNVNEIQQKKIEKVLDSYKDDIETAVLAASGNSLAVDPHAWAFRQVLVSDLAAELSDNQKKEIDLLLNSYSGDLPRHETVFAVNNNPKLKKENFHKTEGKKDFIVITPDTLVVVNIDVNYDSIRYMVKRTKGRGRQPQFSVDLDKLDKSVNNELKLAREELRFVREGLRFTKEFTNEIKRVDDTAAVNTITVVMQRKGNYYSDKGFNRHPRRAINLDRSFEKEIEAEAFEKRIQAYERMAEKQHVKNQEFQQHLKRRYRFEQNDSINNFFNNIQFYDSSDINKHIKMLKGKFRHLQYYDAYNEKSRDNKQFNKIMMSMDTVSRHYRFWQGDSINNFFNEFQFSDTSDINIYIKRFQEKFKHLQFYDTVNVNQKQMLNNILFDEMDMDTIIFTIIN